MKCKDCLINKSSQCFYPHLTRNRCKECYKKLWHKKNTTQERRKYWRERLRTNFKYREAKRLWMRKYYPKWYKKNGRLRSDNYIEISTRYYREHPEVRKAYRIFNKEIRKGNIVRPTICSHCRRKARIYGHHSDYSKPTKVLWLCASCHKRLHTFNSLN